MKKLLFTAAFAACYAATTAQTIPVQVIEATCEGGKARATVTNVGTARIDSVELHFEGANVMMRKPIKPQDVALVSVPGCGCKGVLYGIVVYIGGAGTVIGRDEFTAK